MGNRHMKRGVHPCDRSATLYIPQQSTAQYRFYSRENKGTERDTARPGFGICQVRKSYI